MIFLDFITKFAAIAAAFCLISYYISEKDWKKQRVD